MHSPSPAPVIGITLDYETAGGYSKMPWYAVRENYLTSVAEQGAIPLPLPHHPDLAHAYLDMISGLIITGGAFDIAPELYGEQNVHETVTLKKNRTEFEWAITRGALDRSMPILGICGGQQLLHAILGGTLHQHIPDDVPNALAHEQPNPRTEPGHGITIIPGTLLHQIVGETKIAVNSAHHQAANKPGPGVIISATAEDGVIEAIEYPAHPFCLGVQWHPEYHVTEHDTEIFAAFVHAARAYHG